MEILEWRSVTEIMSFLSSDELKSRSEMAEERVGRFERSYHSKKKEIKD